VCCAEGEKVTKAGANPVQDPCDIGVKVADLGNACWTVKTYDILGNRLPVLKLTLYRMVMPIGTPFLKEKINN